MRNRSLYIIIAVILFGILASVVLFLYPGPFMVDKGSEQPPIDTNTPNITNTPDITSEFTIKESERVVEADPPTPSFVEKTIGEYYSASNFIRTIKVPQIVEGNVMIRNTVNDLFMSARSLGRYSCMPDKEEDQAVDDGGSADIGYRIALYNQRLISVYFYMSCGLTHLAHPFSEFMVVNYDLAKNKQLALGDIFQADSSYLEFLSQYVRTHLPEEIVSEDPGSSYMQGTAPLEGNFAKFYFTDSGLEITFDEYQVASRVSGVGGLTIPYKDLSHILRPEYALQKTQ